MKLTPHIVVRGAERAVDWHTRWGMSQHIRDVPHDEVRAAAEAFGA